MNDTRLSAAEMTNSLTGFDFIAIKSRFKKPIDELDGMEMLYALIYIAHRREGANENDAYQKALNLPMAEAAEFFAPDPDDIDPDDPDTEAGKDSAPSTAKRKSSPRSAS